MGSGLLMRLTETRRLGMPRSFNKAGFKVCAIDTQLYIFVKMF